MDKRWLNNKSVLRITSFAVAIVLWTYVVITQDPPRTSEVDNVEIICGLNQYQLNDGLSIISKSATDLSLKANGKRSLVTGVRGNYYARLNLDNITQPGKYSITPEISKPDGVYISSINPSVVEVYIDKYVSSSVPVNILTEGETPDGYIIKKMTSDIQHATVTLPSLSLEQISYIGVTVNLSEITGSTIVNCTPVIYDKNDKIIEIPSLMTELKNVVVEITAEKTKTVNIVPSVSGAERADMQFSPKTIEIYGDKDVIDSIDSITTKRVVFDTPPVADVEYTAELILPPGVNVKEDTGKYITLKFR